MIYFKNGELIIKQNDKVEGIFFIVEGKAKVYNIEKKKQIFCVLLQQVI